MSREGFYEMRIGEFFEALLAYRREKEDDRRHMGELVRGSTLRLFNLQLSKKDRITDPSKFWRMPWDEDREDENQEEIRRLESLSEEERTAEAMKFLDKVNNGKK